MTPYTDSLSCVDPEVEVRVGQTRRNQGPHLCGSGGRKGKATYPGSSWPFWTGTGRSGGKVLVERLGEYVDPEDTRWS